MSEPMWSMVLFDLPVKTKRQMSEANRFRNELLDLGYQRLQLSVYVQYLPSGARAVGLVKAIKRAIPPEGEVRIFAITDKQWSTAFRFIAAADSEVEDKPSQLQIF